MMIASAFKKHGVILLSLMGGVTACATLPNAQPAVLSETSPDIRQTLSNFMATTLGRDTVTIATRSLTQSPTVILQNKGAADTNDRIITADPQHFDLSLNDGLCRLTHRQTEKFIVLKNVSCTAQDPASS